MTTPTPITATHADHSHGQLPINASGCASSRKEMACDTTGGVGGYFYSQALVRVKYVAAKVARKQAVYDDTRTVRSLHNLRDAVTALTAAQNVLARFDRG